MIITTLIFQSSSIQHGTSANSTSNYDPTLDDDKRTNSEMTKNLMNETGGFGSDDNLNNDDSDSESPDDTQMTEQNPGIVDKLKITKSKTDKTNSCRCSAEEKVS